MQQWLLIICVIVNVVLVNPIIMEVFVIQCVRVELTYLSMGLLVLLVQIYVRVAQIMLHTVLPASVDISIITTASHNVQLDSTEHPISHVKHAQHQQHQYAHNH